MYKRLDALNLTTNKKNWIHIGICIFLVFVSVNINTLALGNPISDPVSIKQEMVPLLLNSGAARTHEAEISVVLWVENAEIPAEVYTKMPLPDWIWINKMKETAHGDVAITLSGHKLINKNEESMLYSWYNTMSEDLAFKGVRIYLDERVPESIDTSAYLSQLNAVPAQWNLNGNLVSIAGYKSEIKSSVLAGLDKINIQILCRSNNLKGQTVLAMPALLEEF